MNVRRQKQRIRDIVEGPMLDMIYEFGLDLYSDNDVAACKAILEDYVDALASLDHPDDAQIMDQVRKTVLALNDWNRYNDFIETEEREWLWEVIQAAAMDCGLRCVPDDVTAQWREW